MSVVYTVAIAPGGFTLLYDRTQSLPFLFFLIIIFTLWDRLAWECRDTFFPKYFQKKM